MFERAAFEVSSSHDVFGPIQITMGQTKISWIQFIFQIKIHTKIKKWKNKFFLLFCENDKLIGKLTIKM